MKKNIGIILISLASIVFLVITSPQLSFPYEKEIKNISSLLSENILKTGKKTVAVVDFTDLQGNVTELGRFLAEELSVALSEAGKGFEVVDRTHLKSLLKEHQLAQTGLIDPKTARKLGEIAGVQGLITGTITPFGDSIRVAVKVLDTETAKVIAGSRADIAKTKAIEELLAKGIETSPTITSEASPPLSPQTKRPVLKKDRAVDIGRFVVEVESLKVMTDGRLMVALAYINESKEDLEVTLDYPPQNNAFASDDAGNQYTLEKSTGMVRRYNDANIDLIDPKSTSLHSTFLLCPPKKRARASFLFRRSSPGGTDANFRPRGMPPKDMKSLGSFTISLGHYARPAKKFDPKNLEGAFGFSATISNVQPD
jgi:TolB-like protein